MNPGRELDALIAEKVMGFKLRRKFHEMIGYEGTIFPIPRYSEDIAAAWEVVEKLRAMGRDLEIRGFMSDDPTGWQVVVDTEFFTLGQTAPHAICLAALKAVGVEI